MKNKSFKNQSFDIRKTTGTAIIVVSAFLLFCLITRSALLGIVGKAVSDLFLGVFGITAYAFSAALLVAGIMVLLNRKITLPKLQIANLSVMFLSVVLLVQLMTSQGSAIANDYAAYLSACYDFSTMSTFGGAFAGLFVWPLCNAITVFGTYVFLIALLILTVFICAEFFFKISNIKFEKDEKFITKDTYVQPQYPQNKLFVATISENKSQPQNVIKPKVSKSISELYGEHISGETETHYDIAPTRTAPQSARDQLYGDLWQDGGNSFTPSSSMSRSNMPETSYIKDFENHFSVPKNNDNITAAPISSFNKSFDEPPAILHGDDQYTSDTLNIKKTEEFLAEEKPQKKSNKEAAKKDLYALKGQMTPDESLPPIVNGDQFSDQLKKKEAYEQYFGQKEEEKNSYTDTAAPQFQPVEKKAVADVKPEHIVKIEAEPAPFVKVEDKSKDKISFTANNELEREEIQDPIVEQDLLSNGELADISIGEAITEPKESEVEIKQEEAEPVKFIEKPFVNGPSGKGFQVKVADEVDIARGEKPLHRYEKYVPPVVQLLDDAVFDPNIMTEDYESIGKSIERTLAQFKVESTFVSYVHGPTVTRYEFEIATGIPVKRVLALADDISMAVAAKTTVRIEAPIPGKNLFGIEVPNKKVAKVPLRSIIESADFQNSNHGLTFALGIDIGGQKIVADLADMPHLLIAGSTGQGKSVCMNSLIISMLFKYSPEELRFILVDPKRVEFSVYNRLPHLMIPDIICEPEKAISAFNWLIKEMERRFSMFAEYGVRDIVGYNKAIDTETTQKLPRIVLVVDEVADLMQYNKSEIEQRIQRLAQKARAAGIHLVLATQRPSVDIITGVIKANFPARIALRVVAVADAKTILAQGGPEKLLGKGDMFFQTATMAEPLRLQGALILDDEVKEVVNFIAANNETYFDTDITDAIMKAKKEASGGASEDDDLDELFYDALKYVIETGQASISMLQRRFSIGYNRAGRLIQDMEEKHLISAFEGAKPRQVLITAEEYEQMFES